MFRVSVRKSTICPGNFKLSNFVINIACWLVVVNLFGNLSELSVISVYIQDHQGHCHPYNRHHLEY